MNQFMSDRFFPSRIDFLLKSIINEQTSHQQTFGTPLIRTIFAQHQKAFGTKIFGYNLKYPLGVAAGPHTQLAQNIVSAWVNGARYMELKTIQTLDELEVSKPCIDAQDEGYNCEWSQELKINESYSQYLDAWILLHILSYQQGVKGTDGTIFNMSVGYNLDGILQKNIQWFFSKMANCKTEKEEKLALIRPVFPQVDEIEIPDCISNNITLSTMHGCPPDEIEKIASYLIKEKKLHTYVKHNPTLLGPVELRDILNEKLKFKTVIPDEAFAHDLKWDDAIHIIEHLRKLAEKNHVEFGLKLTNTLESENRRNVFKPENAMMYMSGRALHPLSVNVARKIQNQFNGELNISFAGGADAFNFTDLISSGLKPVTVCTDLLKPGGYGRLPQYIDELKKGFEKVGAQTVDEFTLKTGSNKTSVTLSALENLNRYADQVINRKDYQRTYLKEPNIKGQRKLDYFDCISAPCMENCATTQNIPQYLGHCANGNLNQALGTILNTNPFPAITGNICDHQCQLRCTRINYDDAVRIRDVKRFIEENHPKESISGKQNDARKKVSIIGAGPSGLSCAYYLLLAGFQIDIYESQGRAGGMVGNAVPSFRLSDTQLSRDIIRIVKLGGVIHYNQKVNKELFAHLTKTSDFIYIATGARLSAPLDLPNVNVKGVIEPLQFLLEAKLGKRNFPGKNIAIIGGGNTAMDVARVAWRLVGYEGKITIVYRRTIAEMPADQGEIEAVIEEGINIMEQVAPVEIKVKEGTVAGMVLAKMGTKEIVGNARPKPEIIPGTEFEMQFDTIIPAVGQAVDIDFIPNEIIKGGKEFYSTGYPEVFIGGDALRGAATAIKAIGDGRHIAEKIIGKSQITYRKGPTDLYSVSDEELMLKKGTRQHRVEIEEVPVEKRRNFNPTTRVMTPEEAKTEANRCLHCDQLCNVCVTVCPNRANVAYQVKPIRLQLYMAELNDEKIEWKPDVLFEVKQGIQIINLADWCNECGNCSTFCPTEGSPYRDKPHLHLSIKSMNQSEEGYFLSRLPQKDVLIYKEKGGIRTLERATDRWIYETDHVRAEFAPDDFKPINAVFKVPCLQQAHFRMVAEMSVIFEGAMSIIA
jgi:putative selenate reductase